MSHKYEILENNTIEVFDNVNPEPFLRQPSWPDGTEWANKAEAEAWVKQYILWLTTEDGDMPGNGPDMPVLPRPIDPRVIIAGIKAKLISGQPLTEEEADLLLGSL